MKSRFWAASAILAIGLVSCAEPPTVPVANAPQVKPTAHGINYEEVGPQQPPPNAPSEFQGPTTLTVTADAGFLNGNGWGQSVINYKGSNALDTVHVDLNRGSEHYSASGVAQASDVFPVDSGIIANASRLLSNICGFIANTFAYGEVWDEWDQEGQPPQIWGRIKNSDTKGVPAPACAKPKARSKVTHGAATGATIDIIIPEGTTADVSFDGTGSQAGESGGPSVTRYDWVLGSTDVGGGGSISSNLSASKGYSLTVTDDVGATASATGAINISYQDPCDDPTTRTVEDCTTNPPSGEVSYDGGGYDDGTYHGGAISSTFVCYVTDWYEWNGSSWVYVDTKTDYCTFE